MKLIEFIQQLKETSEENVQLDFFRENGQVLLQIYKQRDVTKWKWGIDLTDNEGFILNLTFNSQKTQNKENLKRFTTSQKFKDFKSIKLFNQNSFFRGISEKKSTTETANYIIELIGEVYNIDLGTIYYTLKAY